MHWMPTTTATGSVKWSLEYTLSSINATFPTSVKIGSTQYTDGTNYKHNVCNLATIQGTNLGISSMLLCRIYRNATSSVDTYGDDAALLEVDFHYPKNTMGSKETYIK